jgi:hypothetical protein
MQTGRVRQQGTSGPRDARQDEPERDAQGVIQQAQYSSVWSYLGSLELGGTESPVARRPTGCRGNLGSRTWGRAGLTEKRRESAPGQYGLLAQAAAQMKTDSDGRCFVMDMLCLGRSRVGKVDEVNERGGVAKLQHRPWSRALHDDDH